MLAAVKYWVFGMLATYPGDTDSRPARSGLRALSGDPRQAILTVVRALRGSGKQAWRPAPR
jgi:hypothetical protein